MTQVKVYITSVSDLKASRGSHHHTETKAALSWENLQLFNIWGANQSRIWKTLGLHFHTKFQGLIKVSNVSPGLALITCTSLPSFGCLASDQEECPPF